MSNLSGLDDLGMVPRCQQCGSQYVVRDAWACFNPATGLWELEYVGEDAHCHVCEGASTFEWVKADQLSQSRVREINDRFRKTGLGHGTILVTVGVHERGADFVVGAVNAVRLFDDFTDENDPWAEHDFGAVDVQGSKVFFKFDYFADETLSAGSDNPANEKLSFRVMTIMLAEEY